MLRNPERFGVYDTEVVFEATKTARHGRSTLPDGRSFKRNSSRLQLFRLKGTTCVSCGIVGTVFSLEKESGTNHPAHLNLYAITDAGEWVLMTKDHIIPKSKGGMNAMENYNPMCSPCNFRKADALS